MNPTIRRIILNKPLYPLDIIPNAVLALGTTRLSKSYTGALARMRESVASAESDVNSDQNGKLSGAQWGSLVGTSGYNPNNAVSNGDFASGTTWWAASNSTLSATNNILTCTLGNVVGYGGTTASNSTTAIVSINKAYVRVKIKILDDVCQKIGIYFCGSTSGTTMVTVAEQATPANGTQYTISGVVTLGATITGNLLAHIRATYANEVTANGKVIEVQQVIAENLTDKYPSQVATMTDAQLKTWADANIPFYSNANAYGSVVYDQSGNALQAVQTTAANQPMIVMSGNLLDGYKFDETNDGLVVTQTPVINDITNLSVMWVGKFNGSGGGTAGRIFDKSNGAPVSLGRYFYIQGSAMCMYYRQFFATGDIYWNSPSTLVFNKNYVIILVYDNSSNANNPTLYINGIPQALTKTDNASSGAPATDAAQDLYIGNRSAGDRALNGNTKAFIMDDELWTPNTVHRLTQWAFKRFGFTA
jgi:hypothetical protein